MKKNIFFFSLIFILAFSLSACGQKDKNKQIEEEQIQVGEEQLEEPQTYETPLGSVVPEKGVIMKDEGCTNLGGLLKAQCEDSEIKVGGSESGKLCCMRSVLVTNGDLEDQAKIKEVFLSMYPADSVDMTFDGQTAHHARGKVKINGGDFATMDYMIFFASDDGLGNWRITYNPEGVRCTEISSQVFPPYIAEGCIL
jgi:predicted small lipoprotein YifL